MIGADAIIKCLEAEGVSTVFGYPGVAICPFFNSILDSDIKTVLIRTEQNAAHAASGVARMTRGMCGDLRPRCHQCDHRYCHGIC
jgi:acetolactate synthase-1/2/3 large subunit